MNRRGFSFIELLVSMSIVGILANIAVPTIRGVRIRAEAAAVIADINVIRTAAFDYYANAQAFPRSRRWGTIPPELVGSLPDGFRFDDGTTRYRWRRYNRRRARRRGQLAVVSVRSNDRDLIDTVREMYRGGSVAGRGRTVHLYIE